MTDTMTPPLPTPPRWTLPPGACDCHAHVFGPDDRFPVVNAMHYQPPLALAPAHIAMLDRVGLSRGVLVQPGTYGDEPAALLDALGRGDGRLRGIAVADHARHFDAWHEAGIRGLRFNEMLVPGGNARFAGAVGIAALDALAPSMRERGWHAEAWANVAQHAALLPRYRDCGLPIVLDHMAGIKADAPGGIDDPAFRAILDALAEGWLWVKLPLCRASQAFPDYPDLAPFHAALIEANADRLVWGSDWPHLRLAEKTPDVGHLLDLFHAWTADDDVRQRVLASNPAALYDF